MEFSVSFQFVIFFSFVIFTDYFTFEVKKEKIPLLRLVEDIFFCNFMEFKRENIFSQLLLLPLNLYFFFFFAVALVNFIPLTDNIIRDAQTLYNDISNILYLRIEKMQTNKKKKISFNRNFYVVVQTFEI